MIKVYCYSLIFIIILSCNNDNEKFTYYDSGEIKSKYLLNNSIPDGEFKEFYKKGTLKSLTHYNMGKLNDTLFVFYENGGIKEKGILFFGHRFDWWSFYNEKGILSKTIEYYKINNDSSYINQEIFYDQKGNIDTLNSTFFNIILPDTLNLGDHIGYVEYFTKTKGDIRNLNIAVENQYIKSKTKQDTFKQKLINKSKHWFALKADKKGNKKVKLSIIEQVFKFKEEKNDSLIILEANKISFFDTKIFIKDTILPDGSRVR